MSIKIVVYVSNIAAFFFLLTKQWLKQKLVAMKNCKRYAQDSLMKFYRKCPRTE